MPNRDYEMETLKRPLRLSPIGKELQWPSERAASLKPTRVACAACFALMHAAQRSHTWAHVLHVARASLRARSARPRKFLLCAHRCRSARAQRAPLKIFAICRSHWRVRLLFYLTPLTPLKSCAVLPWLAPDTNKPTIRRVYAPRGRSTVSTT
ncbi:unnamed protein product [Amoebophrya sp. A120]|nr:unnamed protein product [Amoebophrya sp. A120]|eukprot:GSA120T00011883001.1